MIDKNVKEMSEVLLREETGHILYCSQELDKYIENAVSYIVFGIKQGDYVLFVENTRIYPRVRKELENQLTEDELEQLLFINNFDFYWRNSSFHPSTILKHFDEATGHLLENGQAVRTWGHIEWGAQEDIEREIVEYETKLDTIVPEKNAISVCAYDASKLTDELRMKLMAVHGIYMTDEEVQTIVLKTVQ